MRKYLCEVRRRRRIKYFEKQKKIQSILQEYGMDIMSSPKFQSTKNNIQHGTISVKDHSINVARYSVRLAKVLPFQVNSEDLVRGALLHDYFLYDWHKPDKNNPHRLHGFFHPGRALQNASRDYNLTKRQRDIIAKHMWPLTITPPTCREAWIVTAADKYISFLETVHLQKGHHYQIDDQKRIG